MKRAGAIAAVCAAGGGAWAQPSSVVFSPHNLSAGGPGAVRAVTEDEVCIFCHTPHNATPVRPLWSRSLPTEAYGVYTSRSLDALPGQPTGMSKMCLSCHDGTIALGAVVSRDGAIAMSGGVLTMPIGAGRLGTDLRDDHPISFRFDKALWARDAKLRDPGSLPPEIRLDANSELQCTSCHRAHDNSLGKFLVMRNDASQLCLSCHQMGVTTVSGHATCEACHRPHTAPSGPYLLSKATIAETCLRCHNGSVAGAPNIAQDIAKPYAHDTHSPVDPPAPTQAHVACADCHEPHTMSSGKGMPPALAPNFGRVSGVSASGGVLATATNEFEVCFKCHAEGAVVQPLIPRRIVQENARLEFAPGAVSYHPVEAPGRSTNVPSLRPGWSTSSIVYCSSCHTSDGAHANGGTGADGTHGSLFAGLLAARYETADNTTESAAAYALCYTCHDRASILGNRSFSEHAKHIVEERAPCAACHDAHGIASNQGNATNNAHLINFATTIVFPDPGSGRLEYRSTGTFRGECFLRCHGETHAPQRYPD